MEKYNRSSLIFLRTFRETVSIPGSGSENTVMFWPEEQMNESLLKRRKGQCLSDTQITHFSSQLERSPIVENSCWKIMGCLDLHWERSPYQWTNQILKNNSLSRFRGRKRVSKEAESYTGSYLILLENQNEF